MPSPIYNISFSGVNENILPPQYRTTKMKSWVNVLTSPIQWLHDKLFTNYIDSQEYDRCDNVTNLAVASAGTLVHFTDNSVWETQVNNVNTLTYNPLTGGTYSGGTVVVGGGVTGETVIWQKIQPDFIGFTERLTFNNQKLKFEYLLNRYFNQFWDTDTSFRIYIENINNSYPMFYVGELDVDTSVVSYDTPEAEYWVSETDDENEDYNFIIWVSTDINTTMGADWQSKIRAIADKYNYYSVIYDVQSYVYIP